MIFDRGRGPTTNHSRYPGAWRRSLLKNVEASAGGSIGPVEGHQVRASTAAPRSAASILARGIDAATAAEIRAALLEHGINLLQDQSEIPQPCTWTSAATSVPHAPGSAADARLSRVVRRFTPSATRRSANGEFWHSGRVVRREPPLRHDAPDSRTARKSAATRCSANMCACRWHALSAPMKQMLAGLTALHESEHIYRGRYSDRGRGRRRAGAIRRRRIPVIRTHPETGRKCDLREPDVHDAHQRAERARRAGAVLDLLFDHCEQIDFQIRVPMGAERRRVLGQPLRDAPRRLGLLGRTSAKGAASRSPAIVHASVAKKPASNLRAAARRRRQHLAGNVVLRHPAGAARRAAPARPRASTDRPPTMRSDCPHRRRPRRQHHRHSGQRRCIRFACLIAHEAVVHDRAHEPVICMVLPAVASIGTSPV